MVPTLLNNIVILAADLIKSLTSLQTNVVLPLFLAIEKELLWHIITVTFMSNLKYVLNKMFSCIVPMSSALRYRSERL